jgi:hypothetical protein
MTKKKKNPVTNYSPLYSILSRNGITVFPKLIFKQQGPSRCLKTPRSRSDVPTRWPHGAVSSFRNSTPTHSLNSPPFMEPEGSLTCSQDPALLPEPEALCNTSFLHGEDLLASRPITKMGAQPYRPSVAAHSLRLPILSTHAGRLPRPQPKDAPCRLRFMINVNYLFYSCVNRSVGQCSSVCRGSTIISAGTWPWMG